MTDTRPPPIDMTDKQLAEAMRDELQHYGADTWTPALYFEAAHRLHASGTLAEDRERRQRRGPE